MSKVDKVCSRKFTVDKPTQVLIGESVESSKSLDLSVLHMERSTILQIT